MKKDKTDRLTDKAFMRLIITSVLAIGVCMVCLCSSTWAWFTESHTSSTNSIKSSNCQLQITVDDGIEGTDDIVCNFIDGTTAELDLHEGVVYNVKLTIPEESASGYCVVKIIDNDSDETNDIKIYSQAVSNSGSPYSRALMFKMMAIEAVKISVIPKWGIYSGQIDVDNDGMIAVSSTNIAAVSGTDADTSETERVSEIESETDDSTETESVTE